MEFDLKWSWTLCFGTLAGRLALQGEKGKKHHLPLLSDWRTLLIYAGMNKHLTDASFAVVDLRLGYIENDPPDAVGLQIGDLVTSRCFRQKL